MILDKDSEAAVSAAGLGGGASRAKRPAQKSTTEEITARQPRRMGASIVKSVAVDRAIQGVGDMTYP